jgi:hypothetical protein
MRLSFLIIPSNSTTFLEKVLPNQKTKRKRYEYQIEKTQGKEGLVIAKKREPFNMVVV